jgi:hypothetical protein
MSYNAAMDATAHPYFKTRGLTTAITVLLLIQVVFLAILVISAAWLTASPDLVVSVVNESEEAGLLGPVLFLLVGFSAIGTTPLTIATATCFLVWLYRATANLPALGSESVAMNHTPARAVWGWFIPFYNLAHGYTAVRHVFVESQRAGVNEAGFPLPVRAGIVGWWWALFLMGNVLLRIAGAGRDPVSVDDYQYMFAMHVPAMAFRLGAALLCIAVVNRIERRQSAQRADLLQRAAAAAVPPPSEGIFR